MSLLLRLVPCRVIRFAGQAQFKFPVLRPLINFFGRRMAGTGRILRGPGQGLSFDARGCNPGFLAGTSEPLEQSLVARFSPPGATVFDLGANAGFYAVLAARGVGPTGRVYAFEPTPAMAQRVRENAARNDFQNVFVIEKAVSDTCGTASFQMLGPSDVSNSLGSGAHSQPVEAVTLDAFCDQAPAPGLLLIDVEGAELLVLKGAMTMITRHRPVMMIEVHWLGGPFLEFVNRELLPLGYTASTYDGKPLPAGHVRYHALLLPNSR